LNNPVLTTADELTEYIEHMDLDRPDDVDVLRRLRDLYETTPANNALRAAARIELNSMTAWLGDGSWPSTLYGVQGTHLPEDLPFLTDRLATTMSAHLRVGYAYVLWQLDRRPERARTAVDAALAMFALVMQRVHAGAIVRSSYVQPLLESALLMSGRSGDAHRRAELMQAIRQTTLDGSVSLQVRRRMIGIALERRADFAAQDLAELIPAAQDILAQSFRGGVAFIAESARVARQLAARAGAPGVDEWKRREANAYLALMETNPQAILYEAAATRAIALLRQIGDDEGRLAVERRYYETLAQQTLQEFGNEIYLGDDIAREREIIVDALNNHGGMGVVAYLALRPSLLPRRADVQRLVDDVFEEAVFLQLAARSRRSFDGRVIAHSNIGDENLGTVFTEQFRLFLSVYSRLAMTAFAEGVASGQVTVEVIRRFLSQTWVGTPEDFALQQDQVVRYDLAWRLMPAFARLLAVYDGAPLDDLIPVVDSFTPALELLLRTLSRRIGLPTIVARPDQLGREVDEVESLGTYLRRAEIRNLLSEDLATALDVILVEPWGYGIRDDVAHGLLFPQQYTLEIATLLAVAIIRVAAISNNAIEAALDHG
jgi:hypothetical protein